MKSPMIDMPFIAETTFTVTAGGEVGPTKLSDLINQYRCPLWVDQIRIAATDYSSFFDLFTKTHTRILFGRYPITREFVPTSVLAPRWPGDGHVVMRLHKPLYVTPQDLPIPTMRSTVEMDIRFSLVGRLASPLPPKQKIWVPYVTAFEGETTAIGETSKQQSNRNDLANPFKKPFTARFILGRRSMTSASVTGGQINNQPSIDVRMSNHLGRPIVRDPTPFLDLFNVRDQAWAINSVMQTGDSFIANVDVDATSATEDQDFEIGVFGYREETVP